MGKSAKLLKRPSKKEKVVIKATVKKTPDVQQEKPASSENTIKTKDVKKPAGFHPYARPTPSKNNAASVKPNNKKASGVSKGRILEGRPDYVDLMYGRPKAKKA